ncbi:MAG: HTH domain-containing protein [Candidatus Omnitrophica bacterium]|jgi:heat-inducible transcriptional repressor|nr:HTH domain-containing protein [Candidatus Omnitrophota bacterium]
MMNKNIDFENRKKAVLAQVINLYIKKAQPVSSDDLARNFELSSATIRNIFKQLEDEGYLTHPYTSGGRIPTVKGYRYYVDILIQQMQLLDGEKERIGNEYKKKLQKLEDLLEATTDVLSAVTHYAGIASVINQDKRLFYKGISSMLEQPEFQDAGQIRNIVRLIEDKQRFFNIINRDFDDKVKIYIGDELGCPEVERCAIVISNYSAGKKTLGKIAVLGPMRMEYNHIIPALEYISDSLSDALEELNDYE